MALTNYKYKEEDSVLHSISEGYKQAKDYWGIPGAIGGLGEYAKNNKWKTFAVVSVVVAVPLIAAYLLSPTYAGFIDTTAASTYAGMIAGSKGLYALAITNPVFTALLTVAIVVTIGALAHMNHSKANQTEEQASTIEKTKGAVLNACEKEGDKLKIDGNGKLTLIHNDASTLLTDIAKVVGLLPEKAATAK